MFAGNFAPVGWALCNGQLLAISEYEPLYYLIGTTYGGDGQSTFAVPDLQGRVPVHMGTLSGNGTVFTLACPFTLLAHYTELEWAESCGVSRNLIRLSVGLEDPEDLWQRLDRALGA